MHALHYIYHILALQLKATLLVVAAMPLQALAQPLRATLSHYSTDNGLPSNAIADIKQDAYGYIWIATWNGVSRFDGFTFRNYETGIGSGLPFMHNRIVEMAIDKWQNVWLRMYDGHIFVVNRKTDRIENPLENLCDNRDMTTETPLCITDNGNTLVFVGGKGMLEMSVAGGVCKAKLVRVGLSVACMDKDEQGTVWIGTKNGLVKYKNGKFTKLKAAATKSIKSICVKDGRVYIGADDGDILAITDDGMQKKLCNAGKSVVSLFADSHNDLWFSTDDRGVCRLDLKSGLTKSYLQDVLVPQDDALGALVSEVAGTVWVRLNRGGFGHYNRKADRIEYFYNDPSTPWSLSNTVGCYLASTDGIVWESTSRRGLERLDIISPTIERIKPFDAQEEKYANNIRAMHYDERNGLLLIGCKNSKLQITDSKGRTTTICVDDKGEPLGRIYGISHDHSGNYWISCKGNGLVRLTRSGDGYTFKRFRHDAKNSQGISSDNVYCTVEDNDGNIWVATYDGGINILTRKGNGETVFLNANNAIRHYPHGAYKKVRTLAKDKQGNIWVGTTDGLLVMSYRDGIVRTEKASGMTVASTGLQNSDIVCLACAPDGTMWIGTNGGGLSRCTGRTAGGKWAFETLGAKTGIPSEEVKSITFDNNGNVWFSTDNTICSYNIRKGIVSVFGVQDGVDDTMCSEGCALTMPNGISLFGTINGYYLVDRKRLGGQAGDALKLRVTDMYVDGDLTAAYTNVGGGDVAHDSLKIQLPRHGSSFSCRFASLNLKWQHRIHYQYLLEGYDKNWRNADESRMAAYSDLPTGTYTLRIRAFLLEKPGKYDTCTVVVKVPPHFLLSANAVWIYIILIIAVAIFMLHLRQERMARMARMRVLKIGPQEIAFKEADDYNFVKQQLDWLEEHYSDSSLKIEDLVAVAKMSRTSYYNELKSLTGLSPKELVSDFRLKKARMMLEKTDTTIAEIAYKTGFNDPVYFTRLFRTTFGQTPTQYRKEHTGA